MAKNKIKRSKRESTKRVDLSYKKSLEIINMDEKDMESSQEQSKKNMDNMNEDLKKRMARYLELEHELIELKLASAEKNKNISVDEDIRNKQDID